MISTRILRHSGFTIVALTLFISPMTLAQSSSGPAHFHHVHYNVTNPAKTLDFYKKYLGAVEVNYRNKSKALFVERSFILLNEVAAPPAWQPLTALSHIGWSSTDGPADFEWLKKQGVEFETEIDSLGNNQGMYFYGPDKELVELWTGSRNHRFEHIHLWATDAEISAKWLEKHLGLAARVSPKPKIQDYENIGALRMAFLQSDNVNLVIFERPDFDSKWWPGGSYKKEDGPQGDFNPTKGTTIDHIAFSYRDIKPVHDSMKAAGAEIVQGIQKSEQYGHTSFFALAPDGILVEIVEQKPIPEGIWDE